MIIDDLEKIIATYGKDGLFTLTDLESFLDLNTIAHLVDKDILMTDNFLDYKINFTDLYRYAKRSFIYDNNYEKFALFLKFCYKYEPEYAINRVHLLRLLLASGNYKEAINYMEYDYENYTPFQIAAQDVYLYLLSYIEMLPIELQNRAKNIKIDDFNGVKVSHKFLYGERNDEMLQDLFNGNFESIIDIINSFDVKYQRDNVLLSICKEVIKSKKDLNKKVTNFVFSLDYQSAYVELLKWKMQRNLLPDENLVLTLLYALQENKYYIFESGNIERLNELKLSKNYTKVFGDYSEIGRILIDSLILKIKDIQEKIKDDSLQIENEKKNKDLQIELEEFSESFKDNEEYIIYLILLANKSIENGYIELAGYYLDRAKKAGIIKCDKRLVNYYYYVKKFKLNESKNKKLSLKR